MLVKRYQDTIRQIIAERIPLARKAKRLVKSEIIPVRIDPQLRMAAEMAAGRERRTLSSLIEWALERAMREYEVAAENGQPVSAWRVAELCWHPDPIWRLQLLAEKFPDFMTFDEKSKWQAIIFMISLEQNIEQKETVAGHFIHVDWLPAMTAVWPYVVENAANLDFVELRRLYLEARPA